MTHQAVQQDSPLNVPHLYRMVVAEFAAARGSEAAIASQKQIGDPHSVTFQGVQQGSLRNVPHFHCAVAATTRN